jgi:hypothetical protein
MNFLRFIADVLLMISSVVPGVNGRQNPIGRQNVKRTSPTSQAEGRIKNSKAQLGDLSRNGPENYMK